MEQRQKIYISAKDSDYIYEIIKNKDWASLIELASTKTAYKNILYPYFETDESQEALKEMTEEQILQLIDHSSQSLANLIFERMESLCDSDEKYTNIALKLMKGIYGHGGHILQSNIVKCLPLNVIKVIIDSRIPYTEFHFGVNKQEFFLLILSKINNNNTNGSESKSIDYKNLKERDAINGVYTYISSEQCSFPLKRREVFKLVIQSLKESFSFIESSNSIDWKSKLISSIIDPIYELIIYGLNNEVWDYINDGEIIGLIKAVFDEFYSSKYFRSRAAKPILSGRGNSSLLDDSEILEKCKVISPNYYYKVFKKAVQDNKENFIDQITRSFFTQCPLLKFIRELDDGVYKALFDATIDMTVRELIERRRSKNFSYCCKLLSQFHCKMGKFVLRYDECIKYIKSVISKLFEKKETLNIDIASYPEICNYILSELADIDYPLRSNDNSFEFYFNKINEKVHMPLDFLDDEMRNKLVLGVIRHPIDETKFSQIITSNDPTILVTYICFLKSVQDIKLVLPKAKRSTVDKYSFRDGKSASNPKETVKMNLVEMFLHTLRFWENHDKSLFISGYVSYYNFVRKILMESILTNDMELKKLAIDVYYRYSDLVSLMNNAKYIDIRIRIASLTFLTPLAVIVGSELDKSFVENYVNKYIQRFNAHSYHSILSEIITRSHIHIDDDDDDENKSDIDEILKKSNIDQKYALATKLILNLIKQNPVKKFDIHINSGVYEDFFISEKKFVHFIKSRFEASNQIIIPVCNPLQTDYPIPIKFNGPNIKVVNVKHPEYKLSYLVLVELARFVGDEFKTYTPKLFKTSLTKALIKIQKFIKDVTSKKYETFNYYFTLDPPTIYTIEEEYYNQQRYQIDILYSRPFFNFLNAIYKNHQNSIFNDECYEIIKAAFLARFLNEEDFLKQKNQPPPIFNGFDISLRFRQHKDARNIFNIMIYKHIVEDYKLKSYKDTNNLNHKLKLQIEQVYNMSKILGDKAIDDVFQADPAIHRSHIKGPSDHQPYYPKNVHKCFTFIMDSLNESKAELFDNDFDSLARISNFHDIKRCASDVQHYSMLTELLDLLINDFTAKSITKKYNNSIATTEDVYLFMLIVAKIASPNIGTLQNLTKLSTLSEKVIAEKIVNRDINLFNSIFKCGNIDQILICMNSPIFSINAPLFNEFLLSRTCLHNAKEIFNKIIDEVSNKGKNILDDFHVALAACAIHPLYVGFPAPQANLDYLKKIANRSLSAKRAACANAVYYGIMNYTAGASVPLNDIIETIEIAYKKSPDEIIAFFCVLIAEEASINKMRQLPALSDLGNESALPKHFVIEQGPLLEIPKEIGDLYYSVIEKVILSGLKSKKSHIYELTVTVLNEINAGAEIQRIISPFIVKGLKEIDPSDDNEAFLRYATSFTMKNPEFSECFDAYVEALAKIKKHSFTILKANAHMKGDSPYPEPFKKLEDSFTTIISTIEKPFSEFKEENEMVAVSQFCRKLRPVLQQNRPAVGRDIFFQLESYTGIFGDEKIEEMVHLYKQENKEDSLSKFIQIATHHEELVINVPKSFRIIYSNLRRSFSVKHTIELSKNLEDSQTKLDVSMQRAYQLANMFSSDVLANMPDGKDKSDDEIIEILSNLGIFCKTNEDISCPITISSSSSSSIEYKKAPTKSKYCISSDSDSDDEFLPGAATSKSSESSEVIEMLRECNKEKAIEPCKKIKCQRDRFGIDEEELSISGNYYDESCEQENDNEISGEFEIEICDENENEIKFEEEEELPESEYEPEEAAEEALSDENEGNGAENDLNEDQIKDAFDIFS